MAKFNLPVIAATNHRIIVLEGISKVIESNPLFKAAKKVATLTQNSLPI